MMVKCEETMVEAQGYERTVAPAGGASVATIESLRARLLSERAASKEARQQAHKIAVKVSELQSRLDAEIEHRKKAEMAMTEVLEVLKIKGITLEVVMAHTPSLSGSSECEEAAHGRSSKDGESDHSSSEGASQPHIGKHQGSVTETLHPKDVELLQEEGSFHEDCYSDKPQVTLEDSSRSDSSEVEKEGANKVNQVCSNEQAVCSDALEEQACALPHQVVELLGANSKPLSVNAVEGGSSTQLSTSLTTQHQKAVDLNMVPVANLMGDSQLRAPANKASSSHVGNETPSSSHVGNEASSSWLASNIEKEKLKGPLLDESATSVTQAPSGLGLKGAHAYEAFQPGDAKMVRGLRTNDMAPVAQERVPGLGHKDMHSGHIPRSGYPYEWPIINGDPLPQMHYVPSTEAPSSRGLMSTSYPGGGLLSSNVAGFDRYPVQASISDSILSLVDDKNGKLGSILMALNLAKQQINDEEYGSPYMEEVYETSPSPFSGNPYPGLYEGVAPQPSYRPRRPEPLNQAPIVHFPMSPKSDYEASTFEVLDGMRRSSLSAYYMPGYDPYLQPKGEVHLGNGITLYTD